MLIPIHEVTPNDWNPNIIDDRQFEGLKQSIRISGGNNDIPIIVRKIGKKYEIIDGEKRWKAMVKLGYRNIECTIVDKTDRAAKLLCLQMNKCRGTINFVKLSGLIDTLENEFGMSIEDIRNETGIDISEIKQANSLNEMEYHGNTEITYGKFEEKIEVVFTFQDEELEILNDVADKQNKTLGELIIKQIT